MLFRMEGKEKNVISESLRQSRKSLRRKRRIEKLLC